MLERIDHLVTVGKSFALETTLSSRCYLRLIPQWKASGYRVKLCFLKLPDADFANRRVAQRAPERLMEDGTHYPADTGKTTPVKPLDDPDFIGAEAALKRASAKAIAKALAAGLEPIVASEPSQDAKGRG